MSVRLSLPKEATKVCTGGLSKILKEFYATVRTEDGGKVSDAISIMEWLLLSTDTKKTKNTKARLFVIKSLKA